MRILYIISDFLFFIIYYVIGYRKIVVLENLNLAYPQKTVKEKKGIAKAFYKHFTDSFIETIKGLSISEKEIKKRYTYSNPELVNNIIAEGKSIALTRAHHANWEWCINMPFFLNSKIKSAFTTINNPYFNKLVKSSREKFGIDCYPSSRSVKEIYHDFKNNVQGVYLLISDQSPQLHKASYWAYFFGVYVPVFTGPESLAKKFDLTVVNCVTTKIKRGYYSTEFQIITKKPKELKEHEITDRYLQLTEEIVKKQPQFYLWSHRRFKHKERFEEWKKLKISKSKKK
jgi:KDO2-lipid IV(A) lauroyltransferase